MPDLANLFFASRPTDREFYIALFEQIEALEVTEQTTAQLINAVRTNKLLQEVSLVSYEVSQGRKPIEAVLELTEKLNQGNISPDSTKDEIEFVTSNLSELIQDTYNLPGLRWRLNTLNQMLGSLRKGDFGFIFARPETGKTTFLADQVSFMATQVDRPILWLNNEEEGKKVMLRIYQAALGVHLDDLLRDWKSHEAAFMDLTKGMIRLVDRSTIDKRTVEKLCEKYNPSLLIFDQIDKIHGFKDDREDLRLGAIYIWARGLAKTYCPTIGVTQANGTGENVRWLTMQHVANAATAKQAEGDWILGIGKDNNPGMDNLRFLHLSKNKLLGDPDTDGSKRHGREQVIINAQIARYEDIQR